jgi:predicted dehydrogenase
LLHKIEAEDTAAAISNRQRRLGILTPVLPPPATSPSSEIHGTEGTVILEHDRIVAANLRNCNPPPSIAPRRKSGFLHRHCRRFSRSPVNPSKFSQAIQQNRAPACDGIEGRRSLALIEAIYRAAETHDKTATV